MKREHVIAILIVATTALGAGLALGEKTYKNDLVHGIVEAVDPLDRSCQKASVAPQSGCPSGCLPRPKHGPEDIGKATECRSVLWVSTCDGDCAPRSGLVRLQDGRFADASTLIVRLSSSKDDHREAFDALDVDLESGISGLYRYRARFENANGDPKRLLDVWGGLEAIESVVEITYSFR